MGRTPSLPPEQKLIKGNLAKDIGATWTRLVLRPHLIWDESQQKMVFPDDPYIEELQQAGIKILATLYFMDGSPHSPPNSNAPDNLLEEIIKHYRGKIWCYQLNNEIEIPAKNISPSQYHKRYQKLSQWIIQHDPQALLIPAGMTRASRQRFLTEYLPVLTTAGFHPPMIDCHFHKLAGSYPKMKNVITEVKQSCQELGFNPQIIFSENSTFVGHDIYYSPKKRITQNEDQQAIEQVLRSVIALSENCFIVAGLAYDRERWVHSKNQDRAATHRFSHNGLIYNRQRDYRGQKKWWPKKSYWAMKQLIKIGRERKIIGLDRLKQSHSRLWCYRFQASKDEHSFYIVWGQSPDNAPLDEKTLSIKLSRPYSGSFRALSLIPAIPSAEIKVDQWQQAFNEHQISVKNGIAELVVNEKPLLLIPILD